MKNEKWGERIVVFSNPRICIQKVDMDPKGKAAICVHNYKSNLILLLSGFLELELFKNTNKYSKEEFSLLNMERDFSVSLDKENSHFLISPLQLYRISSTVGCSFLEMMSPDSSFMFSDTFKLTKDGML